MAMTQHLAAGARVPHVLVVEDDALLGRMIQHGLRPHAAVVVCRSGREAMAALDAGGFDAATVDIGLPDMSGMDVISRARQALPAAGILAVTGQVDITVAVAAMKAGADDFIAKPFRPDRLWAALSTAIDRRQDSIATTRERACQTLAYTDALTGAPNRRLVDEYLARAIEESGRDGQPLTVAYLDVDNFKLFNDVAGHDRGDAILRRLAGLLSTAVREPAVFGRFGGDKFVAIFPGKSVIAARLALSPVAAGMADVDAAVGRPSLPIRVSAGFAAFRGYESARELIAEAERQMHLDKQSWNTLAGPSAGIVRGESPFKATNLKALRGLVKAIDRRDSYTRFHSDHATRLALLLAGEAGLDDDVIRAISVGGPIHDLGKIVVPDEILRKPGPLTADERSTMEEHPVLGAAITAAVTDYQTVIDLVRHHHERFDGAGYPAGLKGTGISEATRIFTVADAYSAMTTDRPYRRALSAGQALDQVRKNEGTQFDPEFARAFSAVIERQPREESAA